MRRLLPLALWLALSAGCSALGLDQFARATCAVDRDCEGLPATEDDCHTWQCNRTTMLCEVDLLDGDEDGAPAMVSPSMATCVMDTTVDCDDAARTTFPMAPELCNGTDDDCNGLPDDGVAATTTDVPLATMGDARAGIVSRATGGDEADLVALFQVDTGMRPRRTVMVRRAGGTPMETVLATSTMGPGGNSPIDLGLGPEAIAAVGSRFAVLFAPIGSCRRLVMAATDAGNTALVAPLALHTDGLPTMDPPPMCNAASRGALAADAGGGGRLLAVYTNPAGADCGAVTASAVMAIGGSVSATLPEIDTGAPIAIGSSVDWLAPAVVASATAGTFFVAFPTASTIEIHRVEVGPGTATRIHEEPVTGASGVTMTLAGSTLSLGWAEGCGASPARARLFSVSGTTLTPGTSITLASGGLSLSITRQPALEEWGFALWGPSGWQLERRDDAGGPVGPAIPVRMIDSDVRPIVRARASGGAYEVIGVDASATTGVGLVTIDTVACLP